MANRNWANGGKIYTMETSPVIVSCRFSVLSTAANGIGALAGPTVSNVYLHSSAPGATNPNPAVGTIVLQLADNYNRLLTSSFAISAPNSGSAIKIDNTAMTIGVAYVITVLGDATAAKWAAIGVPPGVTPAVGVSFIASSTGGAVNTSTARVQAAATAGSGVASIEIVGNSQTTLAPSQLLQSYGAQLIFQCRDYAGALVAPVDGSIISLELTLSNSSVSVQGE